MIDFSTHAVIAFHYDGEIHLRFGVGSGELIINNQKEAEPLISSLE